MSTGRTWIGALLAALILTSTQSASADDVGIAAARLIELGNGGYALEADVTPRLVAALQPPVVPQRFTRIEKPTYRRIGAGLVVRYEFGGSDEGLESGDVLLLPWARSAVLLTARWSDGSVQRAMFLRDSVFIPIPIEALKPTDVSSFEVARKHLGFAFGSPLGIALRLFLLLGIVAATGSWNRAIRLVLAFSGGHALAMVAVDIGVPTPASELALAGLGIATALLARSAMREDGARLWPMSLMTGLVDGLGLADALIATGLRPGQIVPALFGAFAGLDSVLLLVSLFLPAVWRLVSVGRLASAAPVILGGLAVAGSLIAVTSGLATTAEARIDPADRMAAARLDLRSGSGGGGGARAAAPPRRLEDAALIYLTIEPQEVRAEVLLSLQDFLEPLRIAGGPDSVVQVEVQDAIARRAKTMIGETFAVSIDSSDAIPLLERTDFVTFAATGVSTRQEPQPEPLATSVLGVTLVFGVDRPPSEIRATWRIFPTLQTQIPAVWTDPSGSERVTLTPQEPVLEWANDLTSFETPPVEAVEVQPPRWPLASVALLGVAVLASLASFRGRLGDGAYVVIWPALLAAVVLYPFVRSPVVLPGAATLAPSRAEATEIVDGLLTNLYRSFDLRDEEAIYDRLEVSVTGDQLAEVYLENRRALELEDRGGARARVDEVEVLDVRSVRRDGEGGYRVEANWTVAGSVNHFGHVHYRQNRYDAALDLVAVDGTWKIRRIEILDERRVL